MSTSFQRNTWGGTASPQTKEELLQHYSERQPKAFVQLDGFDPNLCDDIVRDCGGYGLVGGETWELMSGLPCVRLLIVPGTPAELVKKICDAAAKFYATSPTSADEWREIAHEHYRQHGGDC